MALTSEDILAQYMAQQQAASKWNSPQNLINLATLGLGGISGLAQGQAQGKQNQLTAEQIAYQQAQDAYLRRMQARQGLAATLRGTLDDRNAAALNFADRAPLGEEQMFTQGMARTRGLSDVASNFKPSAPSDPNILSSYNPGSNILGAFTTPDYRAAISPDATARSIAERRKAMNFINPDFQYGSMGDYGLPSGLDSEVEANRLGAAGDRLSRENQLYQLLTAQMQEASQPFQIPPQQSGAPQEKKKGFWSKLGSALLPIAGVAANFIPGVGPIAGTLLSAAGGAAGGALGGGLQGAILGGTGGAAAGYGLNRGQFGQPNSSVRPGFEGPNLANYGMMPGGFDVNSILMPDVPSFRPPLASTPNTGMTNYPFPVTAQGPQIGRPQTSMPSMRPVASHGYSSTQFPSMRPVASHAPSIQQSILGGTGQGLPAPTGMVQMVSPDGRQVTIPQSQVPQYQQAGWRQAGTQPQVRQSILGGTGFNPAGAQ